MGPILKYSFKPVSFFRQECHYFDSLYGPISTHADRMVKMYIMPTVIYSCK